MDWRKTRHVLDGFINASDAARLVTFGEARGQRSAILRVGRYAIHLEENRPGTRARSIGALVQVHRSRRGWSQTELAERCGMARSNLARLESGRHEPLLSSVKRVASALGVRLSDLIPEPAVRTTAEDRRWLESGIGTWARSLRRLDRKP